MVTYLIVLLSIQSTDSNSIITSSCKTKSWIYSIIDLLNTWFTQYSILKFIYSIHLTKYLVPLVPPWGLRTSSSISRCIAQWDCTGSLKHHSTPIMSVVSIGKYLVTNVSSVPWWNGTSIEYFAVLCSCMTQSSLHSKYPEDPMAKCQMPNILWQALGAIG